MNENNKKNKLSFNKVFGDIREKITKITYYKIKENPAIKQAEILIQGEMKMGEKVIKEPKAKKVPDLHPELKKFIEDQNKRWNEQNKKWESQTELNQEIKHFIKDQNRRWNEQERKWEAQTELNQEIKHFIKDQNRRWNEQNKKWESQTELNNEIKEFIKDQNKKWEAQNELNQEIKEFIKDQNQKWNEQMEFNQEIQKTNQVVLTSIQEILLRLERIESLPTIKKELSSSNQ